ncbi:MAG TPA: NADH-quinone oxidoreductase subunit J [Tepidisphaeraceae bacterium]|jgi:NADH-quinone oxidoreductase subunit J
MVDVIPFVFIGANGPLLAASPAGDIVPTGPIAPVVILSLCVLAGLATWLLLPGRREVALGRIGGVILLAVGLIFAALLIRWTTAMGGMSVYFWLFAAAAMFASIRVITHQKPVYSALYFVLTVFATGGLFVLMWAEFMAAALVLIYAGAILITYVFVIMLASEAVGDRPEDTAAQMASEHDAVSRNPLGAAIVGFTIAGLLIFLITDKSRELQKVDSITPANRPVLHAESAPGAEHATELAHVSPGVDPKVAKDPLAELASAPALGRELIENHAINLQLSAVILTLAMVGAITLARRRVVVSQGEHGPVETMHVPGTPVDDNPHSIAVYGTDNPRHKAYPEN